jgi:hypothetical protein
MSQYFITPSVVWRVYYISIFCWHPDVGRIYLSHFIYYFLYSFFGAGAREVQSAFRAAKENKQENIDYRRHAGHLAQAVGAI